MEWEKDLFPLLTFLLVMLCLQPVRSWRRDILAALATCGALESSSMSCWRSASEGSQRNFSPVADEAGQGKCVDSESFGQHLRTGFLQCSVLIPVPRPGGRKHDCGVSANEKSTQNWSSRQLLAAILMDRCWTTVHPRTGEMPFQGGIPQTDQWLT